MPSYDHKKIEQKWQKRWEESQAFKVSDTPKKKLYVLDMFPYPSGAGLHVGHVEGYTATDIYSRFKRMQGYDVLHPMGWDAFGLPAENYAVKTGIPPVKTTSDAITMFRSQIKRLGLSYDWSREIGTHTPEYYKWTQWLFVKFYNEGLVYKKKALVNWDPVDQTVLANEQVLADGTAERSGAKVVQKELEQWFFKITDFADALVDDLDDVDWPESTKINQRNWIGRSEGAEIDFTILFKLDPKNNEWQDEAGKPGHVAVFTTRPDTLFGATYVVLAPEHPWVTGALQYQRTVFENADEVEAYVEAAKNKTDLERQEGQKDKTGVELKGVKAINPANKEEIPVYVADYVLGSYGTGAIMAVPAHDERDGEFAKKFNLPVKKVVDKTKYLIFDFDGVLGNTFEKCMDVFVKLGIKDSLEEAREEMLTYARNKPRHTRDTTMTPQELENEYSWMKDFGAAMHKENIELFDEFIDEVLKLENTKIAVVSSGSKLYIGPTLEKSKLEPTHVLTFEDHHSKEEKVEMIAREWGVPLEEVFYFTDTKADVYELTAILPKKQIIGCAWGYLGKEELEAVLPREQLLENFSDIHQLFDILHTGNGILINSGEFSGLENNEAKKKITEAVGGKLTKTYRLRDWLISRQRYWGAPIPIVYDPEGKAHAIPEEHLPWMLPTDVEFKPTGTSPLGQSKELLERTEHIFGKGWKPEVDTMDTFMCSSWYFFRFADPHNDKEFASKEAVATWLPVDLYVGGAEHTVLHLMYARFFTKALRKFGYIDFNEPFMKLRHQGTILAEDGTKMSKSKGNVINPDEIIERYGADSLRLYEMFMGPFEAMKPWNTNNILGVRRFLERVWKMAEKVNDTSPDSHTDTVLQQTIKKVSDDLENLKMNTAISSLMMLLNTVEESEQVSKTAYKAFLQLLAPLAPHIASELWEQIGESDLIYQTAWPKADDSKLLSATVPVAVQVNGKVRATLELSANASEEDAVEAAKSNPNVQKWLVEGELRKTIYVAGKILNFVINLR